MSLFNEYFNKIFKSKFLKDLIVCFTIMFVILFFFRSVKVVGSSMDPTLVDGQRGLALLNRFSLYEPKVNDIVLVKKDSYSDRSLIKRVVAIPGDKVEIRDNSLYVNDELVQEPYIKEPMLTNDISLVLGDNEIYILGDNRNNSADSRLPNIGSVNYKDEVIGELIYNLKSFSFIRN